MEKLEADIGGKLKLLVFTLGKTQGTLESGNVLAINRHREALSTIVNQIDILKLQIVEDRFKAGDSEEDISKWSTEIENQFDEVDIKVTHINEHLVALNQKKIPKLKKPRRSLKRRSAKISLNLNAHSMSRN